MDRGKLQGQKSPWRTAERGDKRHTDGLSRFVSKVYDEYVPLLDSREYPYLGRSTINIGTISGGDQPSTVPDHCKIVLDRRMVPSETI